MQQAVLTERQGKIGLITINRPEVRNALDLKTWELLLAAFVELDNDSSISVIVVTGAGDKAFVAGADLNTLKARNSVATFYGEIPAIVARIEKLKKPTIAAINGFALGGGLELAMACDIRIASDKAKLGQTESNVGILPGAGGTQRLSRLVGIGKAKELIYTGDIITAQEALSIGLINRVVTAAELMAETLLMAARIASKSPIVLQVAKRVVSSGADTDLASALTLELMAQSFVFSTNDHLEGICSFLEKREPEFKGE